MLLLLTLFRVNSSKVARGHKSLITAYVCLTGVWHNLVAQIKCLFKLPKDEKFAFKMPLCEISPGVLKSDAAPSHHAIALYTRSLSTGFPFWSNDCIVCCWKNAENSWWVSIYGQRVWIDLWQVLFLRDFRETVVGLVLTGAAEGGTLQIYSAGF